MTYNRLSYKQNYIHIVKGLYEAIRELRYNNIRTPLNVAKFIIQYVNYYQIKSTILSLKTNEDYVNRLLSLEDNYPPLKRLLSYRNKFLLDNAIKCNRVVINNLIWYYNFVGRYVTARELLIKYLIKCNEDVSRVQHLVYQSESISYEMLNYTKADLSLILESLISELRVYRNKNIKDCFLLKNIISSKKVVLIGPSELHNSDYDIINHAEVVVLINHQGFDKTYNTIKEFIDNKKVVSYISGGREKELNFNSNLSTILKEVDLLVTLHKHRLGDYSVNSDSLNNRIQQTKIYPMLNIFGRVNFGSNIIFDLLTFEPLILNIVGLDLYSSNRNYSTSYNSYTQSSGINLMRDIGDHSPLLQFNLVKSLYQSELIIPSKKLEKLLNNGSLNYLAYLENKFQKFFD